MNGNCLDQQCREIAQRQLRALAQLRQVGVETGVALVRAGDLTAWGECGDLMAGAPVVAQNTRKPAPDVSRDKRWKAQRGRYIVPRFVASVGSSKKGQLPQSFAPSVRQ